MKILIADDDEAQAKVLRALLERAGHIVAWASDGLEGLSLLEEQAFDLVISDIMMPQLDGYRFCLRMRKEPKFDSVRFLFHTGTFMSPGDAKVGEDVGGDGFLMKPASAAQLTAAIAEIFSRPHRGRPPGSPQVREFEPGKTYSESLVTRLEQRYYELEVACTDMFRTNEKLVARVEQAERDRDDLTKINHELRAKVALLTANLASGKPAASRPSRERPNR